MWSQLKALGKDMPRAARVLDCLDLEPSSSGAVPPPIPSPPTPTQLVATGTKEVFFSDLGDFLDSLAFPAKPQHKTSFYLMAGSEMVYRT